MQVFDLYTAALLVGLLYLVIPTFTWAVLGEGRNHAALLWCGGGMAIGLAAVCVSAFKGSEQPLLSFTAPVALASISYAMRLQALRLDLGRPWRKANLLLFCVLNVVIFESIRVGLNLYVPRAVYASLTWAVGALLLHRYAREIAVREQSRSAQWIALAYGTVAFAFLLRTFYLLQMDFSQVRGGLATEGRVSAAVTMVMLLSSVIGHFGYIGLALERAQRRVVKTVSEQSRIDEAQRLGVQIALLERRRSMGELAASIGHELKQPLTAILTNTQVAQRGLKTGRIDTPAVQLLLQKIEYNTERASQILERIRNFMRASESERSVVDMHEVVQGVVELIDGEARKNATQIHVWPRRGPALVQGDAIQLSQVVLNLLRNAIESMAHMHEPRLLIECWEGEGRVQVQVRDWGPGLDLHAQGKLGTPFYTTKPQGLGMGLSISRAIAHKHGGTLVLRNATDGRGFGALAVLELPAYVQEVAA